MPPLRSLSDQLSILNAQAQHELALADIGKTRDRLDRLISAAAIANLDYLYEKAKKATAATPVARVKAARPTAGSTDTKGKRT